MFDKKEYSKIYYQKYKKTILENVKKYRQKHKEEIKQYYQNNKDKEKNRSRQWRIDNPEYHKQWSQKYKKEINEYCINKRKIDLKVNLNHKMSAVMYKSLKGNKKSRRWEDLIGYTINDLIKRLKKTMPKGYIWQDYMNGDLHIDHIIPISAFNFNSPDQIDFKRCWALSNLRLLPAEENRKKYSKLIRPFQPILDIGLK